ncbi:MAG: hypothetical protein AAGB18_01075, partial [Pseudomonadota bacterium]
ELYAILDDFGADFGAARRKYGVPSGEPVIGLDVRTSEKLRLAKRRLPERITIRGVGALGRNDFFPTAGTQVGDWSLRSARNIRLMAIQFNGQSNGGPGNFIGATDCVITRNVFNMKAATSTRALAQPNEVKNGIYFYNSSGCTFSENAVVGANFQLINGQQRATDGTSTRGLTIAWNVFDQVRGDHIRLQGGINTNWYIHKNLFGGRFRNPGGDHSDCLQVGAGQRTQFSNSFMEFNCCFVRQSYGRDNHAPVQMWWFGRGSGSSDGHSFQQNGHFAPGRLINNKVPRQGVTLARSVAAYNTDMAPSDIPASYSKGFYSADFACFVYSGRADFNLVTRKSRKTDRGAGPNGLNIECPRSANSSKAPRNAWAPQTEFLSCELQRSVTIGCLKPPSPRVRSHWQNPRPVGAWQLMRDMFEPAAPNHWKSRGWPIDAMCHIAYDPFNELAGTSGLYKAYDSRTGANLG